MKVLFLDIDGVLNRFGVDYWTPHRESPEGFSLQMEQDLVYRLNLIVDRTGCELVLSSSWRHDPRWREVMAANGIVKPFLDRTDVETKKHGGHNGGRKHDGTYQRFRGNVIAAWLREHPEVTRYAILDDGADAGFGLPPSAFFKTETHIGLTVDIAARVEAHLAGE